MISSATVPLDLTDTPISLPSKPLPMNLTWQGTEGEAWCMSKAVLLNPRLCYCICARAFLYRIITHCDIETRLEL